MTTFEIGAEAEKIALDFELYSLDVKYRKKVRLVSSSHALGYDIQSCEVKNGRPQFKAIEVKTWNKDGYFYISKNQVEMLSLLGDSAWIYLVDIPSRKVVRMIKNPIGGNCLQLAPVNFQAFF